MEERVFFDEGGVRVTNARFVVPAQTYTMNGVTSIGKGIVKPGKIGPIIMILVGLGALASGEAAGVLMGLAIIAGGIAWLVLNKPTHIVILKSASGESEALKSKDGTMISKIIEALNDAVIHRG